MEKLSLPLSTRDLARIAFDPLIGRQTSPAMIAEGETLEDFSGRTMFCCFIRSTLPPHDLPTASEFPHR